jgi:hypothetical protein
MTKYLGPIKWLGGIALILFAVALVFGPLTSGLPEETRRSVLLNAAPFFATFVGILLLFILLIVIVATRFNGKVPGRTYQSVEITIILGIVVGVICLFQSWSNTPYQYGFSLLLISTLAFILWSHVVPHSASGEGEPTSGLTTWQRIMALVTGFLAGLLFSINTVFQLLAVILNTTDVSSQPILSFVSNNLLPVHGFFFLVASIMLFWVLSRSTESPLSALDVRNNIVGGLAAFVIVVLLMGSLSAANSPKPPYGLRDRVYNSYDDPRKAQVAMEAEVEFQKVEFPFLIIFSAFPAIIVYFIAREAVVGVFGNKKSSIQSFAIESS